MIFLMGNGLIEKGEVGIMHSAYETQNQSTYHFNTTFIAIIYKKNIYERLKLLAKENCEASLNYFLRNELNNVKNKNLLFRHILNQTLFCK